MQSFILLERASGGRFRTCSLAHFYICLCMQPFERGDTNREGGRWAEGSPYCCIGITRPKGRCTKGEKNYNTPYRVCQYDDASRTTPFKDLKAAGIESLWADTKFRGSADRNWGTTDLWFLAWNQNAISHRWFYCPGFKVAFSWTRKLRMWEWKWCQCEPMNTYPELTV